MMTNNPKRPTFNINSPIMLFHQIVIFPYNQRWHFHTINKIVWILVHVFPPKINLLVLIIHLIHFQNNQKEELNATNYRKKPSVGAAIAAALGTSGRKNGYIEGNGIIVSWCIGHLVGLAEAGSYDERFKKSRYDDLPILSEEWKYALSPGKEEQFAVLKNLMERTDVSEVVNACDAGREGELIFRLVYETAGCKKNISRLWISSMEDTAIREGFQNLKPGAEYEALYYSALCRSKADWLIGINATRLFSVLYHKTLNVGRVQTPTLVMLVDRDSKISGFTKEKYHLVRLELDGIEATSERVSDISEAEQMKKACHERQAVCLCAPGGARF